MNKTLTPKSVVENLYINPKGEIEETDLDEIFANDNLLEMFALEAEIALKKTNRKCESSKHTLLTIEQYASVQKFGKYKFYLS